MSAGTIRGIQRAVNLRMRHTCTIVRTTGGDDWDGGGSDTTVVSNQPCFFAEARSTEVIRSDGTRVIPSATLFLPRDVAVTEGDRITVVTDNLNQSLIVNARGITSVQKFSSHQELTVSGAGA